VEDRRATGNCAAEKQRLKDVHRPYAPGAQFISDFYLLTPAVLFSSLQRFLEIPS
jgi:hypothetical protein